MLVKKNGSTEEKVIPLTTGYITDNNNYLSSYSSFNMKMMASTDKIYFPGTNALAAGRYEVVDSSGNFISTKGIGANSTNYYISVYNQYNYTPGDAYLNTESFNNFNNIKNWTDFATYPNDLSANINGTSYKNIVYYEANNPENIKYVESAGVLRLPIEYNNLDKNYWYDDRWQTGSAIWCNTAYRQSNKLLRIEIYGIDFDEDVKGSYCVGVIKNNYFSAYKDTTNAPLYSAYIVVDSHNLGSYISRNYQTNTMVLQCDTINEWRFEAYYSWYTGNELRGLHYNDKFLVDDEYYTSGITAIVSSAQSTGAYNLNITGSDIKFDFNTTGYPITGKVYKNNDPTVTAEVTAQVTYRKQIQSTVTTAGLTDQHWSGSTGTKTLTGGGGKYTFTGHMYLPYNNNKLMIASKNTTTLTNPSGGIYYDLSSNKIAGYYGGSILFSGANLDSYWNGNKYFYIGMKGTVLNSDFSNWSSYETTANNYACKIYKFNSDHFKKVSTNTYFFEDDNICDLCQNSNYYANPNFNRSYAIGPFFVKMDKIYTATATENTQFVSTLDIKESDGIPIPTVIDCMQYITEGDVDDFVITKPKNSMYYSQDARHYHLGVTNDSTYLSLDFPNQYKPNSPIALNTNITEITKLGKALSGINGIYQAGALTKLTAIKDNWGYGMWITAMNGAFAGATALKEIPDSWKDLGRLQQANTMFKDCKSLTSIPGFYNLGSLAVANSMFEGCTGISSIAGSLTALTAGDAMFRDCKNLTGLPVSWSWMKNNEYANNMFAGCTKLQYIPDDLMSETRLGQNGHFSGMFSGCTALTADIGPILYAITHHYYPGASEYYTDMFKGCTGVHSGSNDYNAITADSTAAGWYNYIFGLN